MFVKQLSIFLENRAGRLSDVLAALSRQKINIIALSLADTAEYGMMRLIVSDAAEAQRTLKAEGFSAMLTDVICVRVNHASGSLHQALKDVLDEVEIEYMYAFSIGSEALNVIKFADPKRAAALIEQNQLGIWSAEDIENL